ncbi:L-threonine 3-dehydrogenase [Phycicoccus endophyticus]|uniref:L-threonine 3-dehydrogenase n=1 Tax=Phycicoccus endophyticus TaxID=1690220 RepID=A0A7G9QZV1_9MICO|nr:L-threonine 3-dehydrogenase [Phycicoccus endophyticus]NHI20077.1 L-threonine 3-dehydrogenase [Phycicoccus endophyticus]QNN48876.1 L-threonine 3-dehydrogenase [Phycicoccus endophyticus]GGL45595.1 L-threonine 3-dehydrogenase [Phycicoccus endophyticus]
MRALRKVSAGPGLELVDIPEPVCGPKDVKVRVARAGLCGTDLHLEGWDDWAASTVRVPMTVGHEFFGEVVQVGSDVDHVTVGDLVSGEGHIVCGTCRNCRAGRRHLCIHTVGVGVNRDGAFADHVVIPATNAWVQPTDLDPDLGALFDPLGNAVHTALQWPVAGEDVVVTGAGPIGVMATAVARHAGARRIAVTDLSARRLELALAAGADHVVDVSLGETLREAQEALGMLEGFDIGLEMSGAPGAVEDLLANMNHGGRVAMLGLPQDRYAIDWGRVITHMITLRGIYGREMFETWYLMGSMLASSARLRSAVSSVVTGRYPAHEWQAAFAEARAGQGGKVVLDWT